MEFVQESLAVPGRHLPGALTSTWQSKILEYLGCGKGLFFFKLQFSLNALNRFAQGADLMHEVIDG